MLALCVSFNAHMNVTVAMIYHDPSTLMKPKNLHENRMCNQWDNWRAYGPELLL